ncbi:MAG: heavy metal-associated domain-containing protein [Bacteroidota bacterium]
MKTLKGKMKSVMLFVIAIFLLNGYSNAQTSAKTDTVKILTSAVCGMCKTRIESNMAYEKGVVEVVLDVDSRICTIVYKTDKTDPDKLRQAISKIGYDADSVLADPKAYEKLPACCKKGGM